jgi:hypothetical protein
MAMTEIAASALKQAVESQHGGTATFVQSVPVYESRNGATVWNSVVHIFDLANSPTGAVRAYAWSYGLPDGKRRSVALLHIPPIIGPREAVNAMVRAGTKN